MFFDKNDLEIETRREWYISSSLALVITILTLVILLYMLYPTVIFYSTNILMCSI